MWAESGRAVVSACPPAGTSVYSETHTVCRYTYSLMTDIGYAHTNTHTKTFFFFFLTHKFKFLINY